jgi:hypothetical protein
MITLILRMVNFLNYYIALVKYCFRQYFTEKWNIKLHNIGVQGTAKNHAAPKAGRWPERNGNAGV